MKQQSIIKLCYYLINCLGFVILTNRWLINIIREVEKRFSILLKFTLNLSIINPLAKTIE